MSPFSILLLELLGYVLAGRLVMKYGSGRWREIAFAALNLAGIYLIFFHENDSRYLPTFVAYLAIVLLQYLMLRTLSGHGWVPWLAFFTPLAALAVIRYIPASLYTRESLFYGPYFIGISYLAFRSSHLALEVRNGTVPKPGILEYFAFCFFVPTMSVGPINPYSNFRLAFAPNPPALPLGRSLLRILVGLVKYKFIGSVFFQLTYTNLLIDDHYHPWIDLPVAAIAYYLFLYCNFSGFCDAAIGTAGLIGIPVAENFQDPFAARNLKEFWNRWHITLSQYMRDVVFSPLSKFLAHRFGPANVNHAIALTIIVVFLLIGIWHGVGWNYALFGATHALGIVVNHYYTIALKARLGRDGFKAYNANRWIQSGAVALTFLYVAASFFFFANTVPEMKQILAALR